MQHPSRLLFSLFTCDSFITGKNAEILRTQLKKSPKKMAHRIVWLDPPWIHGWIPVEESLTNSSQVPVEMNPKLLSWTDSMFVVIQSYRKSVINSVWSWRWTGELKSPEHRLIFYCVVSRRKTTGNRRLQREWSKYPSIIHRFQRIKIPENPAAISFALNTDCNLMDSFQPSSSNSGEKAQNLSLGGDLNPRKSTQSFMNLNLAEIDWELLRFKEAVPPMASGRELKSPQFFETYRFQGVEITETLCSFLITPLFPDLTELVSRKQLKKLPISGNWKPRKSYTSRRQRRRKCGNW